MSCEKAFMEALRARGFRFTPQREMILEVLHHMPGHVTAEEIHSRVRELSSQVDIATVYRTLELLQDLEFVNVIDVGAQGRRYELVGSASPHAHLVCRSCGSILDMEPEAFQSLMAWLDRDQNFEVEVARLTIPGRCAVCRVEPSVGP
jgi:Fur family ferric uptake transcriptional regulator